MSHNDHTDRLIDQALAEKLGGQTPPDLSAGILAAAEADANDAEVRSRPQPTGRSAGRLIAQLATVAALVLLAAGTVWVNRGNSPSERARLAKVDALQSEQRQEAEIKRLLDQLREVRRQRGQTTFDGSKERGLLDEFVAEQEHFRKSIEREKRIRSEIIAAINEQRRTEGRETYSLMMMPTPELEFFESEVELVDDINEAPAEVLAINPLVSDSAPAVVVVADGQIPTLNADWLDVPRYGDGVTTDLDEAVQDRLAASNLSNGSINGIDQFVRRAYVNVAGEPPVTTPSGMSVGGIPSSLVTGEHLVRGSNGGNSVTLNRELAHGRRDFTDFVQILPRPRGQGVGAADTELASIFPARDAEGLGGGREQYSDAAIDEVIKGLSEEDRRLVRDMLEDERLGRGTIDQTGRSVGFGSFTNLGTAARPYLVESSEGGRRFSLGGGDPSLLAQTNAPGVTEYGAITRQDEVIHEFEAMPDQMAYFNRLPAVVPPSEGETGNQAASLNSPGDAQTPFVTSVIPVVEAPDYPSNLSLVISEQGREDLDQLRLAESSVLPRQYWSFPDVDKVADLNAPPRLVEVVQGGSRGISHFPLPRTPLRTTVESRQIAQMQEQLRELAAKGLIRLDDEDATNLMARLDRRVSPSGTREVRLTVPQQRLSTQTGQVLDVKSEFVEVSLGSDDGLRVGDVLQLRHNQVFRGQAVVRRVVDDRAVAEVERSTVSYAVERGLEVHRVGRHELAHLTSTDNPDSSPSDQVAAKKSGDEKPAEEEKPKKTWRRAAATPNASRLVVGDKDELLPQGVQVNVRVDGHRARVLMDLYYYNDRDQALEGNFKLRLPNEASLYYFAFGEMSMEYKPQAGDLASGFITPELVAAAGSSPADIAKLRDQSWENVKEARLVPRAKAAHAYSETVRRSVDPALVEWSGAGVFNARVFPLTPSKLHRIVVGYDMNLTSVGSKEGRENSNEQGEGDAAEPSSLKPQSSNLLYRLDLPTDMAEAVIDISLPVMEDDAFTLTPAMAKNHRPVTWNGRRVYHFENPQAEAIEVRLHEPGNILLTGRDEKTGPYFATQLAADLPADDRKSAPSRGVFLVDTSLSSRPEKFNTQLALLQSLLDENRDELKEFAVVFFNIEQHWWREEFTANTPENVEKLLAFCHTLSLEGATDLRAALAEASRPSWAKGKDEAVDYFLLSDGAATWGETNLHLLADALTDESATAGSLFAYQTGQSGTAVGVLQHLARETGGAVFTVTSDDEVKSVAQAHRRQPWQLVAVSVDGGSDLLLAGRPQTVYPGQRLTLVGRGVPKEDATVVMKLRRGDEEKTLSLPFASRVESELAPRAYGQVAVGQLEDLMHAAEDIAVSYARHFRVTGRTCSLLMLESEEDYDRFHIKAEEDPFVVKSQPAAGFVTTTLAEIGERLADPKASLMHFLDQLAEAPGMEFKVPTSLKLAMKKMPADSFVVTPEKLTCMLRTKDELPKDLYDGPPRPSREEGSTASEGRRTELDYDTVVAEAERRLEKLSTADALKALSGLIENSPGDVVLARDVAFSAAQWKQPGHAVPLLRRVAAMRPYEPQTYQALGQSLAAAGKADLAMVYYEILLNAKFNERYRDLRQVAGVEYLHLLGKVVKGDVETSVPDYAAARREALAEEFKVDGAKLLVTMMWNTDRTDVDLHVIEPGGEECYYSHAETKSGGRITDDVTEGFGPEMYSNQAAPAGEYQVLVNYFGDDNNRTSARTKVMLRVYREFGTPGEQVFSHVVPLKRQEEKREVTRVGVK